MSGLEPEGWIQRGKLPTTLRALLEEVAKVYVPFLLANNRALENGEEEVHCEIDGRPWRQRTFPYQAKCLRWLRSAHAQLDEEDRAAFDSMIAGSGCEELFSTS